MNKLTNKVLEAVSENNNEYRSILRNLNSTIDEKTTNLVSEIVTRTNYNLDFSNTLNSAREYIIYPISRIIESYIIKDLRSVETVNEQFIEKINDKIENATITSDEDRSTFVTGLNTLLHDKYLEIVDIKRISFFNQNHDNEEIEEKIVDFLDNLKDSIEVDMDLLKLIEDYTQEIYKLIENVINAISNLYKDNFINEVNKNLNNIVEVQEEKEEEVFKPFVPEINLMPEVPSFETKEENEAVVDIPNIDTFSNIPEVQEEEKEEKLSAEEGKSDLQVEEEKIQEKENTELEIKPVSPTVVEEDTKLPKYSYDVDEILKIAKSPILEMPAKIDQKEDSFVEIEPIVSTEESDIVESEFNEEEIVKEMITRLTKRLDAIKERKEKYEEESSELEEDEAFVNDLIESSKNKKKELDDFENELDEKELRIEEKKKELEKKINDVMPFANAVLNSEKES